MGAGNVARVYTRWAHLPDRAFRLLVYMALVSLDDADPPLYWGGREALTAALGRITPEEPAPTDTTPRAEEFRHMRAADFQAVKSALSALFKAGVTAVETGAAPGRRVVYRLILDAPTGKDLPTERGRQILPDGVGRSFSTGKADPTPEEESPTGTPQTAEGSRNTQGTTSPQPGTSPAGPAGNNDDQYSAAQTILATLPDFGASLIAQVTANNIREQVIAAAALIPPQRPHLRSVPSPEAS